MKVKGLAREFLIVLGHMYNEKELAIIGVSLMYTVIFVAVVYFWG